MRANVPRDWTKTGLFSAICVAPVVVFDCTRRKELPFTL